MKEAFLRGCPEILFLARCTTHRRAPDCQNPHPTGTLVNRKGLATVRAAARVPISGQPLREAGSIVAKSDEKKSGDRKQRRIARSDGWIESPLFGLERSGTMLKRVFLGSSFFEKGLKCQNLTAKR